jgi:resuscitation-promoting factor RpfB
MKPVRFSIVAASLALAMITADAGAAAASSTVHNGRVAAHVTSVPAPQQIARKLLPAFGWKRRQFKYVNRLWEKESSWNVSAQNPGSGAYGIPQAVPGSKMATAGTDWQTSARTQILWGLGYIRAAYGSPRQAWLHWVADGWY